MTEDRVKGLSVALRQPGPIPLDVAFAVAPGELLALIGPSGSGKTTTLRAIAGHYRPVEGRISSGDTVWFDSMNHVNVPARRRRIGMVFQSYVLFPHLTAAGNVMAAMEDVPARQRRGEASALLARVHLAGLDDVRPAQLSGGQQQRVAVARALARRPDVLLLDEPFSAVDRPTRARLYVELAELRQTLSMPIILVTHDLDEAARLADTAAILSRGRIVASGPIEAVLPRTDLGDALDRDARSVLIHARVAAHDPSSGITTLAHPSGTFFHPLLDAAIGADVRLRIRARDVAIAVGDPGRLSIRNRLAATVTGIVEADPPMVEVHLDAAGDLLMASITTEAARALALHPGLPVTALIKSAAFDRVSLGPAEATDVRSVQR
ncbi:MAG TPA: molybdenum ABC transporter ATP-binding protein [Bauldia sp.]|nr:molybdenum ABC transporter ATP-binding protein [Bauldia sp.]